MKPTKIEQEHYGLLKGRTIRDVVWIEDEVSGKKFPTLILNWTDPDRTKGVVPMAVVTTDAEGNGFINHNIQNGGDS
jgi:hypothetical protein